MQGTRPPGAHEWKDSSISWEKFSDLKESHPIKTAEYAHAQSLMREPVFKWWAPHVLKKRERIIALVKKRSVGYLKKNEKFGIRIPRNAKEAKDVDDANGNTYWQDAIAKEMKNVKPVFKILGPEEHVPNRNFQCVHYHMIFDIKWRTFGARRD